MKMGVRFSLGFSNDRSGDNLIYIGIIDGKLSYIPA